MFLETMKSLFTVLFLIFFILTGVLLAGNMSYKGNFFFLAPFENTSLLIPFLGFSCLGILTGICFIISVQYMFTNTKKDTEDFSSKENGE
jgi:cbb3-type cytochrome oxidase subunit 3